MSKWETRAARDAETAASPAEIAEMKAVAAALCRTALEDMWAVLPDRGGQSAHRFRLRSAAFGSWHAPLSRPDTTMLGGRLRFSPKCGQVLQTREFLRVCLYDGGRWKQGISRTFPSSKAIKGFGAMALKCNHSVHAWFQQQVRKYGNETLVHVLWHREGKL